MAQTFVQGNHNEALTSSASLAVAFGSNNTLNNLIVYTVVWDNSASVNPTFSDTRGNTIIDSGNGILNNAGGGFKQQTICVLAAKAGANTFTASFSGTSPGFIGVTCSEFNDSVNTGGWSIDKIVQTTGTTPPPVSGSTAATTQANEIVFGVTTTDGGVITAGAGFTAGPDNQPGGITTLTEYKFVSSTGTQSAAFVEATASNWIVQVTTFFATSAFTLVSAPLGFAIRNKYPIKKGPFDSRVTLVPGSIAPPALVSLSGLTFTRAPTSTGVSAKTGLSFIGDVKNRGNANPSPKSSLSIIGDIKNKGAANLLSKSALAAFGNTKSKGSAGSFSKIAISALGFIRDTGGGGAIVKAAVSAKTLVASFAKASSAGITPLSAKTLVASFGKAGISAASNFTSLLAQSFASLRSSAGASLRTGLTGTGKGTSSGKGLSSFVSRLSAIGLASLRSVGQASGRLSVAARSFSALTAKIGATYPARLSGTALGTVVGKAASLSGRVSLAGSTLAALFGKLAKPGALQLLAIGFARLAASAGVAGKVPLSGTLKITSSAKANASIFRQLAGKAFSSLRASGGMLNKVGLTATAKYQVTGKAIYIRFALLSGAARSAARASSNLAGVLTLRGRTAIVSFNRAAISASAPMIFLAGKTLIKITSRALLRIFAPGRIANTVFESRVANAEKKHTTVATSDIRSVDAPTNNRIAIASEEDRNAET